MFSLDIIDTDLFMDMPATTQNLYFHLALRADDEGFVGSPKRIMKLCSCSEDDFKILLVKAFIFKFETGICVITHWKVHNYIQKDRYKETLYTIEKDQIEINKNGVYTKCIQDVSEMDTQISLGKVSLVKKSKKKKPSNLFNYENKVKHLDYVWLEPEKHNDLTINYGYLITEKYIMKLDAWLSNKPKEQPESPTGKRNHYKTIKNWLVDADIIPIPKEKQHEKYDEAEYIEEWKKDEAAGLHIKEVIIPDPESAAYFKKIKER